MKSRHFNILLVAWLFVFSSGAMRALHTDIAHAHGAASETRSESASITCADCADAHTSGTSAHDCTLCQFFTTLSAASLAANAGMAASIPPVAAVCPLNIVIPMDCRALGRSSRAPPLSPNR